MHRSWRRSLPWLVFVCVLPSSTVSAVDLAEQIRSESEFAGGAIVHVHCGDGRLLAELARAENAVLQGLETDREQVQAVRDRLRELGLYGRVSVALFDGQTLPYVDHLINLVIIEEASDVLREEAWRVLAPGGALVVLEGDRCDVKHKPWPDEIDAWSHYLHGPDNNAVARDMVADQPRSIQWISAPRFARSHEELASLSIAVTESGRLFSIIDEAPPASIRFRGDWWLVAQDAFNGTSLWKRKIDVWTDHLRHFRSGPVHLQRRLVADGDHVFVTLGLGQPVSMLDAATGQTEKVFPETQFAEEIVVDQGVLYVVTGSSEASRMGEGLFGRDEPPVRDVRHIKAIDIASGETRWQYGFDNNDFVLPLTLGVAEGAVCYQSTKGVGCLDAQSGDLRWQTPRATPRRRMGFSAPTLVIADGVVVCADREPSPGKPETEAAASGSIEWGVHGWNQQGFSRKGPSTIRAYDLQSGEELWNAPCAEQYNAPTDVFVIDKTVWVGTAFRGHDLKTGDVVETLDWKGPPVSMPHHRCYRNKATERLIFTGRSGVEVVSLEDGWLGNNSWVRGTCQYGVMPANGLIYAPPNACACNNKVKVLGYFAGAPQRELATPPANPRQEKGPAAANMSAMKRLTPEEIPDAWPMYRRDGRRSGASTNSISPNLTETWTTSLVAPLTQPIVVGPRVYVASVDTHTIHALDSATGETRWAFTAGGRIDSAPTFYRGLLLFGAADGWVYCLDAATGKLAWRTEAAPRTQLIAAFGQLESTWPVHGSVLVQDDAVYVAAGRNSYLDGGISLLRLDPFTGAVTARKTIYHLDPETGEQIGVERSRGFDMEGVRLDLLSGDGQSIFMKHCRFDAEWNQLERNVPHLFSVDGFLGEEWFVRSYWIYGTNVTAGWGGWATAAGFSPFGRIMSVTDDAIYGYGRVTVSGGPTGHRADDYHLYRRALPQSTAEASESKKRPSLAPPTWSDTESLMVRAMAVGGNQLIVAGVPDLGEKSTGLLAFDNQPEALAAFEGERGAFLRVISTENGETQSEIKLAACPTFDGLSVAHGRVFVALVSGDVVCLKSD